MSAIISKLSNKENEEQNKKLLEIYVEFQEFYDHFEFQLKQQGIVVIIMLLLMLITTVLTGVFYILMSKAVNKEKRN